MPSISECLKRKRIATRNNGSDRLIYQCTKVKAVVEDGKIISISKSD
jgi:hypothetical protein